MTAMQGPRQSTTDSAAPNIMSGQVAHPDPKVSAHAAYTHWMATTLPLDADNNVLYGRAEWLLAYAEELARLTRALRAEVLRDMKQDAGGWRALGGQLGVAESTLRDRAAQ